MTAQGNLIIEVADRDIDNGDGSTETVPGGAVLSTVTAGNDVDITAGTGGLDITQMLTAGGTINIATTASLTGTLIEGGDSVSLVATDVLELDDLTVGDDLTADAAGIDIDTTTVGGSASILAGVDGAMFNALTVGNDLSVVSAADLVINNAASGGAGAIQTMGNLSVIESIAAGGPLNMTSAQSITADSIESGADAVLAADDQITIDTLVVANDLSMTATGIDLDDTTIGGSALLAAG